MVSLEVLNNFENLIQFGHKPSVLSAHSQQTAPVPKKQMFQPRTWGGWLFQKTGLVISVESETQNKTVKMPDLMSGFGLFLVRKHLNVLEYK